MSWPHRLPSLAKKSRGPFQDPALLRQDLVLTAQTLQFGSRIVLAVDHGGRTRSPIPATADPAHQRRESATARCVWPLVSTRRTASSSNSCVNRLCLVIEFSSRLRKTLHCFEASPHSGSARLAYGQHPGGKNERPLAGALTAAPFRGAGRSRVRARWPSRSPSPPGRAPASAPWTCRARCLRR